MAATSRSSTPLQRAEHRRAPSCAPSDPGCVGAAGTGQTRHRLTSVTGERGVPAVAAARTPESRVRRRARFSRRSHLPGQAERLQPFLRRQQRTGRAGAALGRSVHVRVLEPCRFQASVEGDTRIGREGLAVLLERHALRRQLLDGRSHIADPPGGHSPRLAGIVRRPIAVDGAMAAGQIPTAAQIFPSLVRARVPAPIIAPTTPRPGRAARAPRPGSPGRSGPARDREPTA